MPEHYEPYGDAWRRTMMKLTKAQIVDILKAAALQHATSQQEDCVILARLDLVDRNRNTAGGAFRRTLPVEIWHERTRSRRNTSATSPSPPCATPR